LADGQGDAVRESKRDAKVLEKAAAAGEVASPAIASWNRVVAWLYEVDSFRQMAA
jgi:hypothetical protein